MRWLVTGIGTICLLLAGGAPATVGQASLATETLSCVVRHDNVIIRDDQGHPIDHGQRGQRFHVRAVMPDGSYAGYLREDGFDGYANAADLDCRG